MKERYIKICPKCGSTEIQTDFSNPVVWNYGTNVKYKCTACGFLSPFFPETSDKDAQKYKSELIKEIKEKKIKQEKEELVDIRTGYSVGVYELVIILIAIILIVFLLSK